jgi:hypothetical protein
MRSYHLLEVVTFHLLLVSFSLCTICRCVTSRLLVVVTDLPAMQILVVQVRFGDLHPSASHFSMSSHRSIRHRRLLLGKRVGRKRKPGTAFCSPKIFFYVLKSTTALQGVGRLVCIVLGRMLVVSGCNRHIRSIESGCHLCILDELGILAHFHGDSSSL